jgi:hypothetical protein
MEFEKYFYKMIQELNQSTINSALMKHQSIKDKNPISKNRSENFSKRAESQGEKRGTLIRTVNNPKYPTTDYANFYIESATRQNFTVVRMKALMVDPDEEKGSLEPAELTYLVESNTLFSKTQNDHSQKQRWLLSKTDAQNLWKTIKNLTGISVSWKSMDFVNSDQ